MHKVIFLKSFIINEVDDHNGGKRKSKNGRQLTCALVISNDTKQHLDVVHCRQCEEDLGGQPRSAIFCDLLLVSVFNQNDSNDDGGLRDCCEITRGYFLELGYRCVIVELETLKILGIGWRIDFVSLWFCQNQADDREYEREQFFRSREVADIGEV